MTSIRWFNASDPFGQLDRLQREMDQVFSALRPAGTSAALERTGVYPALNLYDDGESLVVRAEVPGVDPKSLDVSVTGDTLTLKGERPASEAPEGASFHRRERGVGTFQRAMNLPVAVDTQKVAATYREGVLDIRLPRAEHAKPRRITVKAS